MVIETHIGCPREMLHKVPDCCNDASSIPAGFHIAEWHFIVYVETTTVNFSRSIEMKAKRLWVIFAAAGLFAATGVVSGQEGTPQKPAAPPVFGAQLMTQQELIEHRAKMRSAKTPTEREAVRAEHHKAMLERAKEKGVTLPETPPPRGMGRGAGMGPAPGGMGPAGGMRAPN